MKNFEDPIQFCALNEINGVKIVYSELMEISQGGPEVGKISINGVALKGFYGGPILSKNDCIYIPFYIKKIFGTGFKLVRINIFTHIIEYLSNTENLIYLDKIEDNLVFYYVDIEKKQQKYVVDNN